MTSIRFHCYKRGYKTYSIDMIIAYVNIFKPSMVKLPVKSLLHNLNDNCWGSGWGSDEGYSPIDVINNIHDDKYKDELKRINLVLDYPIVVRYKNNEIIDGMHRLCKKVLEEEEFIYAYILDKQLEKKFILKHADITHLFQNGELIYYKLIELFYERFH